MRFRDVVVNREERFSIGIEEESSRFYVSIPVSNPYVDYSEYYEIDAATFERFIGDAVAAGEFADRCRAREMDHVLLYQPGRLRGSGA
ncbi:hypothetical protein J5X84_08165 [Streptosporangiaceae bacterium NEAU-GS5]|nr:hypothetical protein [Streptosporangiaceae bacterium NEAU-GS5]